MRDKAGADRLGGMPTSYLPYTPDQQLLLPHALQDWLPQGHLAHYINDTVDALDLSAFFKRYEGGGSRNQPFHPAMMVKVLVYGYATGVFSSRKIAKKLHEDVAFRVLGADNFPKHRTLSDFRALHLAELAALFVQVVKLAGECGLVKLGTIAVDGTKLRAKASKHKAMSYERMQAREIELKAQIDALLKRAAQTDQAEANDPELDIPAELARRQQRLAAIEAAKQRLEARQREADTQRGRRGRWRCAVRRTPWQGRGRAAATQETRPGLQARIWRARAQGAGQLHRPRESHHEDQHGLRAVLQRADCGGCGGADHRGSRADQLRGRQSLTARDVGRRAAQHRASAASAAGGRRLSQRSRTGAAQRQGRRSDRGAGA